MSQPYYHRHQEAADKISQLSLEILAYGQKLPQFVRVKFLQAIPKYAARIMDLSDVYSSFTIEHSYHIAHATGVTNFHPLRSQEGGEEPLGIIKKTTEHLPLEDRIEFFNLLSKYTKLWLNFLQAGDSPAWKLRKRIMEYITTLKAQHKQQNTISI